MRRSTLLLLSVLVLSCDSVGGPFIITDGGGTAPSQLRMLHASANATNLQLLTSGQAKFGPIGFGSVTPYADVTTATVDLTITMGTTTVIDTIISIPDSTLLTIVADGDSSDIQVRVVTDQRPLNDTTFVKIRALNEAPSNGTFDLYITQPLVAIDTVTPTVANIGFRTATSYTILESGTYQVRLTTSGTKTVMVDTGSLDVGNGDVRTVVVLDAVGGGAPPHFVVLNDAGT